MNPDYLQEIESKFCQIRGRGLVLSGADFQIALNWASREIPLRIVLRAMEDVHKTFNSQKRADRINSLSYFGQAVEKEFAEWSKTQVGKYKEEVNDMQTTAAAAPALSEEIQILENLQFRLSKAEGLKPKEPLLSAIGLADDTLLNLIAEIKEASVSPLDFEEIEEILTKERANLELAMVLSVSEKERAAIIESVKKEYADLKVKITQEVQQKVLIKRLYDKFELPELTLCQF